jgi:hypothetical protein
VVAGGAMAKILRIPAIQSDFDKLGVGAYTQVLGFFELFFLALLIYPKTMKWGFFLFCSYLGGAMATHLSHGEAFLQPAAPLLLIYLNVFLRDKTIFYPSSNHPLIEN